MLVITRNDDEAIRIGPDVRIVVRRVGRRIRVAIDAPREVHVRREELPELPAAAAPASLPQPRPTAA